jgi:hypothetical protein
MTTTPGHPRPNFFILLGIAPDEPWDEVAYARALSEKRNLWSRQVQGIRIQDKAQAQRNLSSVREIEHVMRDPRAREAERLAALRHNEDEFHQRRAVIADQLSIRLTKGYLTEEEYEEVRGEEAVQADDSLRQILESAERRPGGQDGRGRDQQDRLDQPTWQALREHLRTVGQPDLYAALRTVAPGVDEAAPAERLLEAADDLYRKARNTANKNLPEVGAMQNLAGLARRIFGSPDLRSRHDASMRMQGLDALIERYESSMRVARAIDSAQFERFLAEAAAQAIDVEAARSDLTTRFRKQGWAVEMPSAATEARLRALVRCPRCSRLNAQDAEHCADCGRAMRGKCPRCAADVSGAERACQACGFPVGERDYAGYLVEQAEACLARNDVAGADQHATEARQLWPVPDDRPDALSDRQRAIRERIDDLRATRHKLIEQVNMLMEGRSYRAAARLLRAAVAAHPDMAGPLRQCEEAIEDSDQRCREARSPGLSSEQRADLYEEALRLCTDNDDARRELSLIPLSPGVLGPLSAQGHPPRAFMGLYVHETELDWPHVGRGEVRVVCAGPGDRLLRAGTEFPEAELAEHRALSGGTPDTWFIDREWLRRYTLVLVLHGRCYVGETRCYARGPEVGDLHAEHAGTSVRITWDWPEGVDEALVAWDSAVEIADPVNASAQRYVPREPGAATGRHDVRAPGVLFVKVAAVVRDQETAFITSGMRAEVRRREITVRYEVKSGLGRKARLLLTADQLDQLPGLVLSGRPDNRPAGPADPEVLAIRAGGAEREIPILLADKEGRRLQPRSCRLFVADDADSEAVRIIDPP